MINSESLQAEEFAAWISSWPDGIIALDKDSRILYFNPKASEIIGWQTTDVVGKHVHDTLCTQNRETAHSIDECVFSQLHSGAVIEPVSGFWLRSDGNYLSVDFRCFPLLSEANTTNLLVFTNNTDRLHNQAEMEKFAEYADKNPMPIAEFDVEGQMLYCNPAMQEALLDYGFNDLGQAVFLPDRIVQICIEGSRNEEGFANVEHKINERWFTWHFQALEGQDQISIMGYCVDITSEKKTEIELSAARAEARRNFYAKMVHELRTPLNAIIGFSDVLLWRSVSKLEERDKRALRTIKIAGIQLNEMVSDTLDISKIEAGKMSVDLESFYLADIFKDIHDQMDYLAEAKNLIYYNNCELETQLYGDKRKVRQIIINLISNAIKYTKAGEVKVFVSSPHYAKLNEGEGEYFSLVVSDTGIGIPEEQIDILFQAYERVREDKNLGIQGTGVGLALVQELTNILQGKIAVESVYGEGTTFTLELPISLQITEE